MSLKTKLNREIERKYGCKKNSLKSAIDFLRTKMTVEEIHDAAKGCYQYCQKYNNDFTVAFNFYASCKKNPKREAHS